MDELRQSFVDAREAMDRFIADDASLDRVQRVARLMAARIGEGGKILAIGNGGSLCDAMHFCEELTGRYRDDRRPLPAIACADPTHLTCVANDYGFEQVFSRWIAGVGREGDVLVALSTSGNSPNILAGVRTAREMGLHTVGLLGRDGGTLLRESLLEHAWVVPGETSDRIQEIHMVILHTLVQGIEANIG